MNCDLMLLAGTRPEALKLAPLARVLRASAAWCWTGQQRTIPAQTANLPWQQLPQLPHPLRRRQLQQALVASIGGSFDRLRPRAVLVQGDTASAFAGARAAFGAGIGVIHLEAGLRSCDLRSPFPEEAYRRAITQIAALHLAPSARAATQLREEGIPAQRIVLVGSTAVDGLQAELPVPALLRLDLLVDVHRRENAGRALDQLAQALSALAGRGWRIAVAAHPNRFWTQRWDAALGASTKVLRLAPMERAAWLAQARSAGAVLSDSGGAAEELPYLGVPLLVYRRRSERLEALESGHARWLSPDPHGPLESRIAAALADRRWPLPWPFALHSPYGDGHAGRRAAAAIDAWLQQNDAAAFNPSRVCA